MPVEYKELFFSDPRVQVDKESGLIWKPVLRDGKWEAGPNGKPFQVIAGRSVNQRSAIGLQDIVDNFKKIEHVTIPLSHDDKVEENTGYVRDLKISKVDGVSYLMAAHDFTEPDIKAKIERGTIPNTSCGLEFDYTHKESGKKIPVVLKHVALTHRPFINRLTPFGVNASEDSTDEYEVEALEFSEPTPVEEVAHLDKANWDSEFSIEAIRTQIAETLLADEVEPVTMARESVLLKDKKSGKSYVARYSIDGGKVSVVDRGEWVEHLDELPATEEVTAPPEVDPPADINPPEEETPVPEAQIETIDELRERLAAAEASAEAERAQRASLETKVASLSEESRERQAEDFISHLRGIGLTEEAGCTDLLAYTRSVMLSDEGESAILLSEDGDEAPKTFTATAMIKEIFSRIPTDEKTGQIAVALSEQHSDPLGQSGGNKPPRVDEREVSLAEGTEEFEKAQDELYERMYSYAPTSA